MVISRFTVPCKAFTLPVKPNNSSWRSSILVMTCLCVYHDDYFTTFTTAVHWWLFHNLKVLLQLSFLDNAWGALHKFRWREKNKEKKQTNTKATPLVSWPCKMMLTVECRQMILNPTWLTVILYQKEVNILNFIWITLSHITRPILPTVALQSFQTIWIK